MMTCMFFGPWAGLTMVCSMSAVRERVTRLERDWERFVRFERDLLKVRSDVTFLMAPHQTPQRSDDDRT